jgi:hypothetical protein
VYKAITNSKRSFHIVGGGGKSSKRTLPVISGHDFPVSYFNEITIPTAQRRIIRAGCFLRPSLRAWDETALRAAAAERSNPDNFPDSAANHLAILPPHSVSAGRGFFASCFNTVIKKVSTKQPGNAPFAGAVFLRVCEAVQGRKYSCKR